MLQEDCRWYAAAHLHGLKPFSSFSLGHRASISHAGDLCQNRLATLHLRSMHCPEVSRIISCCSDGAQVLCWTLSIQQKQFMG